MMLQWLDGRGHIIKAPVFLSGLFAAFLAVMPDGFRGDSGTAEACPTDQSQLIMSCP